MTDVAILSTSFPRWEDDFQGQFIFDVARLQIGLGDHIEVVAPHTADALRRQELSGIKVRRFSYMLPYSLERICYGGGLIQNLKNSWIARLTLPIFLMAFFFASIGPVRRAEVVHAHWPVAGLIALVLGRIFGRKIVLTVHGVEVFQNKVSRLTRLCINAADHVICNSYATKDRTIEIANPKRVEVIPFGVQVPTEECDGKTTSVSTPYVLSVGRLVPRKGIEFLLEAATEILSRTNCRFVIAGDGPLKEGLQRLTKKQGISEYVSFPGRVSNDYLHTLMANAALLVHPVVTTPDGDREGLGIVALEAMSHGKPVVASDIGGLHDVVVDGDTGFLVPERDSCALAERVIQLLKDGELNAAMGARGKQRVIQHFSQSQGAVKTSGLYGELAGNA